MFVVAYMDREIWQLIVSQEHPDDSEPMYRLAEKIVLHLGSVYEWPSNAIKTFAGMPGTLKHVAAGGCMGRFVFALWAIGNGCPGVLLKEWVEKRKLINDASDMRAFSKLVDGLAAGTITEAAGKPLTFTLMACHRSRCCELKERVCTRSACEEPKAIPNDKLTVPCPECSEAYYVQHYGRLTKAEWSFLEPAVQAYNRELLEKYCMTPPELLGPIEMRLDMRLRGQYVIEPSE